MPARLRLGSIFVVLCHFGACGLSRVVVLMMQGALTGTVSSTILYVGSGGCDGTDRSCHEQPDQARVMRAFELHADGGLVPRPALALDLGEQPVWLAAAESPSGRCTFAALFGKSSVASFRVQSDGRWLPQGVGTPSGGINPVFIAPTVPRDGRNFLLVANYHGPDDANSSDGAGVASFRIEEDCSLEFADAKAHGGSSVDPQRQRGAHVHAFVPARDGLAYACDLGMDLIFTYEVQAAGTLQERSRTKTPAGSGPRHLVQHPSKPFVYVVCEMSQAVLVYRENGEGTLTLLQSLSLVPPGAGGEGSKAAEILILPDGSAVYATNRGAQNTVTAFAVHEEGILEQLQQLDAPAYPRGMTLAFSGSLLLIAGQSHSEVAAYHVQPGGRLEPTGSRVSVGLPPNPAAFLVLEIAESPTDAM